MKEKLVLVGLNQKKIGEALEEKVHKNLLLHLSVTVFIFNDKGELLIGKISKNKTLWPLVWESSPSTHVYPGESPITAAERVLKKEFGIITRLKIVTSFKYKIRYKNRGGENEICYLLTGEYNGKIKTRSKKLREYRWLSLDYINNRMNSNPEAFAPWFKIAVHQYMAKIKNKHSLKEEYHLILSQVGEAVDKFLIEYLEKKAYKEFPEKKILYEPMLKKKIGKEKLRAMIVYLSYSFFKNRLMPIKGKIVRTMTAIELINWASYIANWIFDKKAGVTDHQKIKETLIASHAMVEDALRIASSVNQDCLDIILDCKKWVWRSFIPEMFYLKMSNKKLMKEFRIFWESYRNMAYFGVGKMFGLCVKLGFVLSKSKNKKTYKRLNKLLEDYGEYLETLNALQDFVIGEWERSNEKGIMDVFPDLKIGTPTLPIWIMYNYASKNEKKFLESFQNKTKFSKKEAEKVIKLFYESGAYSYCSKLLREKFKIYKKEIKKIRGNEKIKDLFNIVFTIFVTNRFLYTLKANSHKFPSDKISIKSLSNFKLV